MAKPIIATNVSDIPEILDGCGWFAEPENPKQLVETIQHVFDHPKRSMRGRTITHAFLFNLDDYKTPLPQVVGNDDALEAIWMPFNDVQLNEEMFFEDHIHIINHFINRI